MANGKHETSRSWLRAARRDNKIAAAYAGLSTNRESMGHYASEIMCEKCGSIRCACPKTPDKTLDKWIVYNFSPRPASEMSFPQRMLATLYDTQEQAAAAIPALLDARIKAQELELMRLQQMRSALGS
jgi:hypothetical protein